MVGIPGKSNGCHTCRRRKIKCDLQEPHCLRCSKSGRICEGYERRAVFLNRTQNGLQKRKRFEEVLPNRQSTSQTSKNEPNDNVHNVAGHIIPLSLQSCEAWMLHFQGLFMETYSPIYSNTRSTIGTWIYEAIRLHNPGKALEHTLQAIFIARAGRISENQDLLNHGRVIYGTALHELQLALWSKDLSRKDETLASCLGCALYEVFEPTSNSLRGYGNHISGIERLVEHRGKGSIESLLGEAIIEDIARASMIRGLQHRTRSKIKYLLPPINSWGRVDRQKQNLCLMGFDLGILIEDMDSLSKSPTSSTRYEAQSELITRFLILDNDFDAWYTAYTAISPTPLFWSSSPEDNTMTFPALHHAHHMLDFWALSLIFGGILLQLNNHLKKLPPTSLDIAIAHHFTQLTCKHNPQKLVLQANYIMNSMPFCMSEEFGIASSQKCLFAGRVALHILQRFGGGLYEECVQKYLDLDGKKGLRFARDMVLQAGIWRGSLD